MFPKTLKGRLFAFLTFLNLGMASYFAAVDFTEQSVMSGLTAFLCSVVWLSELYTKE